MTLCRMEPHQHPAIQLERRNLVADALLRARCCGLDVLAELLKRAALVRVELRQERGNRGGLALHPMRRAAMRCHTGSVDKAAATGGNAKTDAITPKM